MTIWAQVIEGVPVPLTYRGKEWIDSEGVQHPRNALKDPDFRAAHNIVEILPASYDPRTQTASGVTGYVDNGNGTWSEQRIITLRPLETLRQQALARIDQKRKAVLRGGITVLGKPISTDLGDIDKYTLIASSLSLGEVYPAGGIKVFTLEGERVQVSEANFSVLIKALAMHFYKTDNNADLHISMVEALTTQQDIISYDLMVGWPANPEVIV